MTTHSRNVRAFLCIASLVVSFACGASAPESGDAGASVGAGAGGAGGSDASGAAGSLGGNVATGGEGPVERKAVRVLFIGNSYTAVNGLPSVIAKMSEAADSPLELSVAQHTPGGASWAVHDNSVALTERIAERWDYVVLQDQSQQPWYWGGINFPLLSLASKARAAGATPVLYMTWARSAANTTPDLRFSMNVAVNRHYVSHADAVGGIVAPVGRAWERALRDDAVVLHQADGSHPNAQGTYLAACVFYATLTGESPLGLSLGGLAVDAQDAAELQRVAADTIAARVPPSRPLLGSWPLSGSKAGQDLLVADALSLGDTSGPAVLGAPGTQFGPAKFAIAPFLAGRIEPASITISLHASRPDWSATDDNTQHLLSRPGSFAVYQTAGMLSAEIYLQEASPAPALSYPIDGLAPGWHHFAVTHSGSMLALWIDGEQVVSDTRIGVLHGGAADSSLMIGALPATRGRVLAGSEFTGALAGVTIHEGVRTGVEVRGK